MPFGQTFLRQNKALAVILQKFNRRGAPASEYKQAAGERIGGQFLPA
jgi:hypothetical protein